MRLVVLMLLAMAAAACASAPSLPSLQQAVVLHNTYKHEVEAADGFLSSIYDDAEHVAGSMFVNDEAAYKRAMAPFNAALNALQVARQGEQLLHLAVSQWQAGLDDGGMVREVAACGAKALDGLAPALANLAGGEVWYGATSVLAAQLLTLSADKPCVTPAKLVEVLK